MRESLGKRDQSPALRLSQMGPRCPKALWHSIHTPELAEPLPPWTRLRFTTGHTVEALAIALAKAAGHEVTGEQDEVSVLGVKGHRDCIIDGVLCDVKSCFGHTFEKFKDGTIQVSDTFGYMDQLDGYMVGSIEDDLVRVKDVAYDWAIDITKGRMVLHEHYLRKDHILERVANYKAIVALPSPPECQCELIPDGKSGNLILGVNASYSAFKFVCHPKLRIFIYKDGTGTKLRHFARVVKRPLAKIIELDRYGRRVYNN